LPVLFALNINRAPYAKSVAIAANQTVTVELPIEAALDLGITFMAPANVSAKLIDASGKEAATNESGSQESRAWFRSMYVDHAVAPGTWKLVLQNTGDRDAEAVITIWTGAVR